MNEKKLGLGNVVSISVGLVVATSCLVSLGNGAGTLGVTFILAMAIAMLLNMTTVASLSELNALMPNTTGGIAQYTLAALGPFPTLISMVGGYIICNTMSCGVEASIFSFSLADVVGGHIPSFVYTFIMTVIILLANLRGVDMFAKIQDIVAFLLVGSLVAMGFIGMIGMGTGVKVQQPYVLNADFKDIAAMTAVAFWLFIGAEYAIPISKEVKNAKRNVPLGMMIGLFLIFIMQSVMVFGFHNYVDWGELADSAAPHLLYGYAVLGEAGKVCNDRGLLAAEGQVDEILQFKKLQLVGHGLKLRCLAGVEAFQPFGEVIQLLHVDREHFHSLENSIEAVDLLHLAVGLDRIADLQRLQQFHAVCVLVMRNGERDGRHTVFRVVGTTQNCAHHDHCPPFFR